MAIEQVNNVRVNYNTREFHTGFGKPNTLGATKELAVDFDSANLPSAGDVDDAVVPVLPEGAVVKTSYLIVTEDFVGGTSLTVGTAKAVDGTDLDADGISGPTPTASLVKGAVVIGDGAQVGASLVEAAKLVVSADGTFTEGKARLVVEYIEV